MGGWFGDRIGIVFMLDFFNFYEDPEGDKAMENALWCQMAALAATESSINIGGSSPGKSYSGPRFRWCAQALHNMLFLAKENTEARLYLSWSATAKESF